MPRDNSSWLLPGTMQLSMLQQLGAPQDLKGFNSQQFSLALPLRTRVVDTWLWALCAPLRVHIATLPRLSRGGRPDSGPSTSSHDPSMFHCLSTSQISFVLEYSLHSGLMG